MQDGSSIVDAGCPNPVTYYIDHDGDGFGGDVSVVACTPPAHVNRVLHDLSTGDWVTQSGDCFDDSTKAHPGQTAFDGMPYMLPGSDVPRYDWDCDGVEEAQHTSPIFVSVAASCTLTPFGSGPNGGYGCTGSGWSTNGNRGASGIPGINDLCGGRSTGCTPPVNGSNICTTTQGPLNANGCR